MDVRPPAIPSEIAQRAVAAVRWARLLREAAGTLRHHAANVKFHPLTGQRPQPAPPLLEALQRLEQAVREIQQASGELLVTDADLGACGDGARRELQAAREAGARGAQITAAAAQVLREVLLHPDGATLDAPYGHGAPRRHHPGALCTLVAQRAEELAAALETGAVLAVNLALRPR
jgi:hypothetical protein